MYNIEAMVESLSEFFVARANVLGVGYFREIENAWSPCFVISADRLDQIGVSVYEDEVIGDRCVTETEGIHLVTCPRCADRATAAFVFAELNASDDEYEEDGRVPNINQINDWETFEALLPTTKVLS